jgi:hypothetical protein
MSAEEEKGGYRAFLVKIGGCGGQEKFCPRRAGPRNAEKQNKTKSSGTPYFGSGRKGSPDLSGLPNKNLSGLPNKKFVSQFWNYCTKYLM